MATRGYEITGPLQRSRSNYYKPPTQTSYESDLYMDEKMGYQTQTTTIPPLNTRRDPLATTNAPPPVPPPPKFEDATMVSIPADMFDRMFLRAQDQAKPDVGNSGSHHRQFANPTPLSVVGFLLALSPLSCDLMGWRGAGGNGAASIGAYFFIGGLLMLLGGFLEYVAGPANTFPFVVFASFGGFWLSYGATLLPFFNAFGAYSPSTDEEDITLGLATKGFNASFGFFMLFMALLCLVYLICALRTNIVFCVIFGGLFVGFVFLTATFWFVAEGNATASRMLYLGGASFFLSCMAGWYLLFALLFIAVDFPLRLPLVDLSVWVKGYEEKKKAF
ncbi:hypothetical protein G647_00945 [Cladophialophora carrionii CBS 160.54]|uniref:GPR1/FUN34/YaaH-class plasma membrane protein n=1 Tax=Cladophialophora carrionii CBS 160.54 TaxID=1279043 RepID=V9DPB8_9EURO|nr:uncharacterized protein G647_00945 [Cladophialophora carrionii CBS 160.54]ETI28496.1 hypothetical protein G647_00945 [Cladophialophora carrionii CBS 160.54]